jgi:anti-sigma B factor antagonist
MLLKPASPLLRADIAINGSTALLTVSGELDMATAPLIVEGVDEILDAGTRDIEVDLSAVTFMDTSGLQALLVSSMRAGAAGGALALRSPSERVLNVLRITDTLAGFRVRP